MSLEDFHLTGKVGGRLPYLILLNLAAPWLPDPISDTIQVLQTLRDMASSDPAFEEEAISLVERADWRGNLVGAVAALFLRDPEDALTRLWDRLEKGSWVSPQLACVLERLDPAFADHARRARSRLGRRGIAEPEPVTPESHSRRGPETPSESTEKTIGALRLLTEVREKGVARVPPYGPGTEHQREGWVTAWGWRSRLLPVLAELPWAQAW